MEVPHDADVFGRGERMTEEEMLEAESFWCENCCNFDKDCIGPDGMAHCKITNTLAYCQESGKDCPFFNVPVSDVVRVVRCKNCAVPHNKWTGCPHLNGLIPPPDHYCAKGVRREQE